MNEISNASISQLKIDNLEFARKSLKIHVTILVFEFLRLKSELFSELGQLDCKLEGGASSEGLPLIRLMVRGELQLCCQRCLGSFSYQVNIASNFAIVAKDAIPVHEPDEVDFLEENLQMSVIDLIEDEVLLSLPLAPKHSLQTCGASENLNALKKPSPFAALAALKKTM